MTIFSPTICDCHIDPKYVEWISLFSPNFWQDYGGDQFLPRFQIVKEEKRKTPCPTVFREKKIVSATQGDRNPLNFCKFDDYCRVLEFCEKYGERNNYKLTSSEINFDWGQIFKSCQEYNAKYPSVYGETKTIFEERPFAKSDSLHAHYMGTYGYNLEHVPDYQPYLPEWEWGRRVGENTDPDAIEALPLDHRFKKTWPKNIRVGAAKVV